MNLRNSNTNVYNGNIPKFIPHMQHAIQININTPLGLLVHVSYKPACLARYEYSTWTAEPHCFAWVPFVEKFDDLCGITIRQRAQSCAHYCRTFTKIASTKSNHHMCLLRDVQVFETEIDALGLYVDAFQSKDWNEWHASWNCKSVVVASLGRSSFEQSFCIQGEFYG